MDHGEKIALQNTVNNQYFQIAALDHHIFISREVFINRITELEDLKETANAAVPENATLRDRIAARDSKIAALLGAKAATACITILKKVRPGTVVSQPTPRPMIQPIDDFLPSDEEELTFTHKGKKRAYKEDTAVEYEDTGDEHSSTIVTKPSIKELKH